MASENQSEAVQREGAKLFASELNEALDRAIGLIKSMPVMRENSLAITKIEEAQMWLKKGAENA